MKLPRNKTIKVHLAGAECHFFLPSARAVGLKYALMSAYPLLSPIIGLDSAAYGQKYVTAPISDLIRSYIKTFNHTIIDSGIFSLAYGRHAKELTKKEYFAYFDSLISFIKENVPREYPNRISCMEFDSQSILGVEETWVLRKEMKRQLPEYDIMNIFHLSDGIEGIKKIAEFSDYIGVPYMEYRTTRKHRGLNDFLTRSCLLIREVNPSCRIHLLGCTSPSVYESTNLSSLADTCDSIGWLSACKFPGNARARRIFNCFNGYENPFKEKIIEIAKPEIDLTKMSDKGVNYITRVMLAMKDSLMRYEKLIGPQD